MKKLSKTHPTVAAEWHPTKNGDLTPEDVRPNQNTNVWWLCSKDPRHEWQTTIYQRAMNGTGCSYCSGRKVLREESFAALNDEIFKEWHPTKNEGVDPYELSPHSSKKVWWQCKNNEKHEWQTTIVRRVRDKSGCRKCNQIRTTLAKSNPEVAAEWHPTMNGDLTPETVAPRSDIKVWWQCPTNQDHVWKTMLKTRTVSDSGCPQCRKQSYKRLPLLSEYSAELTAEWHPSKNGELKPQNITAGSNQKVWWLCSRDNSHVWQAKVVHRTRGGRQCPLCVPLRSSYKNSITANYSELLQEWHPTKNKGLDPDKIPKGSAKRVWWRCKKDPAHEWETYVFSRTRNKQGCPYCAGHKVTDENSLLVNFPEIAEEWHPTKNNDFALEEVTRGSKKKVWWLCKNNPAHEWAAQVKNRALLGSGCPICNREAAIKRLNAALVETVIENTKFHETFLENIENIRKLSKVEVDNSVLQQTYNRLLFANVITAMETYLSDAFINTVISNTSLTNKLMKETPEFSKRKYALEELLTWADDTKKSITEHLLAIVYHNIAKVGNMYKAVLGVEFPDELEKIYQAIEKRHDIVHRNGKTKTGESIEVLKSDINSNIKLVTAFIEDIDKQLNEMLNVNIESKK